MSVGHGGVYLEDQSIVGTQVSGLLQMLHRHARLAKKEHDPPTDVPRRRQMRIEPDCAPDQSSATLNVTANSGNSVCGLGKRKRVILAELCRPCCQLDALGNFPRAVAYPSVRLSLYMAIRCHRVGGCKFRFDLDRLLKKMKCLADTFLCPLMQAVQAQQRARVGIKPTLRGNLDALDFQLFEFRNECAYHTRGDLVLQIERVSQISVEATRPQANHSRRIDQLGHNPHPTSLLAQGPVNDVARTEFDYQLLNVQFLALISPSSAAPDDQQIVESRQCDGDFIDETVDEMILLPIRRKIGKWNNQNGSPVASRR